MSGTYATAVPSDSDELRAYARGRSAEAFERLVQRHVDMVYSLCRRELRDQHLAEDATQAVFILLAQKSAHVRGGASLAGWLYQAARYCCRNARRSSARRARHEQEAARQWPGNMPNQPAPSDELEREELEQAVHAALGRLGARERELVLMRYFEQLTFGQVGKILGVSEDAAKQRVARAVQKLGAVMSRSEPAPSGMTAAALAGIAPAWLQAHAIQAAPAGLIQAASAGASGAAAAGQPLAIAKAAAAAWMQSKIASAAGIVIAAGATVGTAGMGWHFLHASEPQPPIAAAPVPIAAAPAPHVAAAPRVTTQPATIHSPATLPADLTTPLGMFHAFSQRAKALDDKGMAELIVLGDSDNDRIVRKSLKVAVCQHRMTQAMMQAFGKDVDPFNFNTPTIDQVLDILMIFPGGMEIAESGDTATVTMHFPRAAKELNVVRAWDGAVFNLTRDPRDVTWKFNLPDLLQFTTRGHDGAWHNARADQLLPFLDMVIEAADKTSAEISIGLITDPRAVGPRFRELTARDFGIMESSVVPRKKPANSAR